METFICDVQSLYPFDNARQCFSTRIPISKIAYLLEIGYFGKERKL